MEKNLYYNVVIHLIRKILLLSRRFDSLSCDVSLISSSTLPFLEDDISDLKSRIKSLQTAQFWLSVALAVASLVLFFHILTLHL